MRLLCRGTPFAVALAALQRVACDLEELEEVSLQHCSGPHGGACDEEEEMEDALENHMLLLQRLRPQQAKKEEVPNAMSEIDTDNSSASALHNGTLALMQGQLQDDCQDTPGWTNNYNCWREGKRENDGCSRGGWTCEAYSIQGWCRDSSVVASWAVTPVLGNPNLNCCVCGKSLATGAGESCSRYGCGGSYRPGQPCQCTFECSRYQNCCPDYSATCEKPGVRMTGYHQTSPEICRSIMSSNFLIGHGGWCGAAVYFARTPEATVTKAITANSHDGCMIEAQVDMGRIYHAPGRKSCDGYNAQKAAHNGYDSVIFNPGDGEELVVYSPGRIKAKRILNYQERWRVKSLRRRRRGN